MGELDSAAAAATFRNGGRAVTAPSDHRTLAAIAAVPAPWKDGGMYAEVWARADRKEYDPLRLSGTRMTERRVLLDRLRWRDGDCCFYCLRSVRPVDETIDHYEPMSAGGSDHLENLRLACRPCNEEKASLIPTDAVHEHRWPSLVPGPVRCYLCPAVRPAVAGQPALQTPQSRPLRGAHWLEGWFKGLGRSAQQRIYDTERKRAADHAQRQAEEQAAAAERRRLWGQRHMHSYPENSIDAVCRCGAPRSPESRAAWRKRQQAGVPLTELRRPGYSPGESKREFWRGAVGRWLDDGGPAHPDESTDADEQSAEYQPKEEDQA